MKCLCTCVILSILVLYGLKSNGQQDKSSKYFAPVISPSPALGSLGKYGNLPVELSTGAATASIPLYDLKLKDNYSVSLGLNYSSNGVKLDDIAGNVGTDWSFIGAFAIKRTVFDDPDELSSDYSRLLDNGFNLDSLSKMVYYGAGTYIDVQPDLFTLIAPGFAGKFYLSGDTAVFLNRASSYKITMIKGYGFKVTDGKGNVLLYGGDAIEKTRMQPACPTEAHFPGSYSPTAWFLKSIVTPAKDTVNFAYSNLNYVYTTNVNTTDVEEQKAIQRTPTCPCFTEAKYTCTTEMIVESKKLDYITSSNNAKILFDYDSRKDNISDKLIKVIGVYSTFGGKDVLLRNIRLDYVYGLNKKRPFLSKAVTIAADGKDSITYSLLYNKIDALPDRLDPQVDFWGYYNANANAPGINTNVSYYGTLAKIVYPTGGTDTLFYDGNKVNTWVTSRNWGNEVTMNGYGIDDHQCKTYTQVLTVRKGEGDFTFRVSAEAVWEFPQSPDPMMHQLNISIKDMATGRIYYSKRVSAGTLLPYEEFSLGGDTVNLEITMTPCGQYVHGYLWVSRSHTTGSFVDQPFGGVRTEKVISADNFGKKQVKRYYYHFPGRPDASSGLALSNPKFVEEYNTITYCSAGDWSNCYYRLRHNKSLIDLFAYGNSPIYYSYVTEGFGENYENGGVRHTFDVRLPSEASTIWTANTGNQYNNTFYEAPYNILREQVAVEKVIEVFKMVNGSEKIVKKEENEFYWPAELSRSRKGYTFRQRIFNGTWNALANYYTQFDVNSYSYLSSWFGRSKVTETIYSDDDKTLVTETSFYYDNIPANNNLTRTEELSSEKDTIRISYKYSNSFKGQLVYDSMVARNVLDTVVERTELLNREAVQTDKVTFGFINGSSTAAVPVKVSIQKSDYLLENWYTFHQYDSFGNLLERSKENDAREVYIWGYDHEYPVAKVVGSTYETVKSFINQNVINAPADDQQLRDELKNIKIRLAGTKALVTIYTYLPMVGMTSETDPAGKVTFYEYDSLQRLKLIRDQNGKILKQYDYQYQKPVTQ